MISRMAKIIRHWFLSSLTRLALLKMSLRIAIVIMAVALLSYWHIFATLEEQTYDNLQNYITERGQKESARFMLAEDNHRLFRKTFLEAWPKASKQNSQPRFDSLFFDPSDGTLRMKAERFEGFERPNGTTSRHITAFVGKHTTVDEALRSKLLLAYDLIDQYADGWSHRFTNLYLTTPENALVIHWPSLPWALDSGADLDINKVEWGYISDPAHNPTRESAWTGLFYDPLSKAWMVSCKTPIDYNGVPLADIGHEILLNYLFKRVASDHLSGTYNFIFRADGRLIAHPALFSNPELMAENEAGRTFQVADLGDRGLVHATELIINADNTFEGTVIDDVSGDALLAVTRIQGPDWYFVTVYPKSLISSAALNSSYFIFLLGFFSIIIEVLMLYLVFSRQIISPLKHFVMAAKQISHGNFSYITRPAKAKFVDRLDEVGVLGASLREMAITIQNNDERLEQEVKQRTQDLNTTNQTLRDEIEERQKLEVKLLELANTDALTGVHSRSYFFRLADAELKRSRRNNTKLYAIVIDIDNFKNINDSYGHPAGDAVLKQFAQICLQCLREIDVFGRLGGEEFGLLLTASEEAEVMQVSERIRNLLEQTVMSFEGHEIELTASFGCAQRQDDHDDINAVLALADKALYQAKNGGRNQVVMASEAS